MAKKLPAPFKRPSVAIEIPGVKKEWREIAADFVHVGDIARGRNRGLVENVEHFDEHVRLTFKNGTQETFYLDDKLTAFTEARNGDS